MPAWRPDLVGAPGVEGVVDEAGPFEEPVVVGFDVEPPRPMASRPGGERVGVDLGVDVGGVHDAGQPDQGRVAAEVVVVDEHLEGALAVAVVELGAGGVEAVGTLWSATARTSSVGT